LRSDEEVPPWRTQTNIAPTVPAELRRGNSYRLAGQEPPETWCRPTVSERDRQARCIFAQPGHRNSPASESGAKVCCRRQLGLPARLRARWQTRRLNTEPQGWLHRPATEKPRSTGERAGLRGTLRRGSPKCERRTHRYNNDCGARKNPAEVRLVQHREGRLAFQTFAEAVTHSAKGQASPLHQRGGWQLVAVSAFRPSPHEKVPPKRGKAEP
jgi:hypothetical protein